MTELEYVLGLAAFGLAKVFAALATLTVTAYLLFDSGLDQIGWSLVPIAAILLVVGWAVGIANIGLLLRFGQSRRRSSLGE